MSSHSNLPYRRANGAQLNYDKDGHAINGPAAWGGISKEIADSFHAELDTRDWDMAAEASK